VNNLLGLRIINNHIEFPSPATMLETSNLDVGFDDAVLPVIELI
jgi:hypothetical protein